MILYRRGYSRAECLKNVALLAARTLARAHGATRAADEGHLVGWESFQFRRMGGRFRCQGNATSPGSDSEKGCGFTPIVLLVPK